ncbi:hypothetical protein PV325_012446 [Microctonus aethiopoides]|uniref:THAP-type domain-containing protein n=1 Tax=Microctonus aethiopoides TaxID=144406 RepID=A0AA39KPN3_9HYME|nr:hypothetical protein PV325_012446 [Microctonus aethiopoides]KAK0169255.1 hypothetical protein PV328_012279 [Microctonus aethiopoides]
MYFHRREQWKNFAEFEGSTQNLRICSDHFDKRDVKKNTPPKRLLVPNAVPTLLPPKEILERTQDVCNKRRILQTDETAKAALTNSSVTEKRGVTLEYPTSEAIIIERPALKDKTDVCIMTTALFLKC